VLLEFEWVMRGFYGLARADIMQVLSALLGIEHITMPGKIRVASVFLQQDKHREMTRLM